ncbi:response regulator [Paraburkholderia unamae]|uniref:response regulator n=1 Tax=Paraburkholderia unamae TaxID=219649 RepID=UPI00215E5B9E|nr:response regulator [Paraburkholderia unamae]
MKTILLVDDDPLLLDALAALVAAGGYAVCRAGDGAEALRRARAYAPTVIVTDYMMPIMSGEALVRALARDPALANIPVVLSSAIAAPPPDLPIAAFLRKPFAAERLLALLHQHSVGRS